MMEFPKPESNIEKWLMKREITLFFFSAGVSRLASTEVTKPAWDVLLSSTEDISDISDISNVNHPEREV